MPLSSMLSIVLVTRLASLGLPLHDSRPERCAIGPKGALGVSAALQGLQAGDGCRLDGVQVDREQMLVRWSDALGSIESPLLLVRPGCTSELVRPGRDLVIASAPAELTRRCPAAVEAVARLVRETAFVVAPSERASGDGQVEGVEWVLPAPAAVAGLLQVEWVLALGLALLALWRARDAIRRTAVALSLLACMALAARLLFADFWAGDEQLPYVTQAACIAFAEIRSTYNLCAVRAFGDLHQLGTASLFALGFRIFGGYKVVAGSIGIGLSVLNTLLLFAVAQVAFGRRSVAFGAGMLLALNPWAIHFAAATQTETLNDTMLLLGVLLVLWDARRGSAPPISLATRIAASPLFRAFFVGMAVAVRPELALLVPLFASLWLGRSLGRYRGARKALDFALLAVLFGVPGWLGVLVKAHDAVPPGVQLRLLGLYLIDLSRVMLPSAAAAVLVLVAPLCVVWSTEDIRQRARRLALLTLVVGAVYAAAQGLFAHVARQQPHVLYHGTVLWWPALAWLCVSVCERAARRFCPRLPTRFARGAALVALAALPLGIPARPARSLWVFRDPLLARPHELATHVAHGSGILVLGAVLASGEIAAVLAEDQRDCVIYDPPLWDAYVEDDRVCPGLMHAAATMVAEGRPLMLVAVVAGAAALAERCGLALGPRRVVAAYDMYDVVKVSD